MQRYLITGASRGIGRAIAEALAGPGRLLLLHGRDGEALVETSRLVEAKGAQVVRLIFDLRELPEIERLLIEIGGAPLDALINNAGIAVVKPLDALSLDDWESTFRISVTAAFLLTQRLTTSMAAGGAVVNILSIAAKTGFAGWSSYCASKFALEGFSQAVREELRPRGIRVINIYPAATNTEIWKTVEGEWPRGKMLAAREVGEAVAYALARPPEIAVDGVSLSSISGRL